MGIFGNSLLVIMLQPWLGGSCDASQRHYSLKSSSRPWPLLNYSTSNDYNKNTSYNSLIFIEQIRPSKSLRLGVKSSNPSPTSSHHQNFRPRIKPSKKSTRLHQVRSMVLHPHTFALPERCVSWATVKKTGRILSMKYWLFNRDPHNWLIIILNIAVYNKSILIPYIFPKQRTGALFFTCSVGDLVGWFQKTHFLHQGSLLDPAPWVTDLSANHELMGWKYTRKINKISAKWGWICK